MTVDLSLHPLAHRTHQTKNLIIKKGSIEIQNVNFAYNDKKVLNNLSLIIPAGKKIALVGLSGSGKSTIINLILRFFDPNQGKILIDNQDISLFSLNSLRQNISLVTQETTLFNDTIESNIRYGKLDASSEEVKIAIKKAEANEFIDGLPNGLDTVIGESGIKLSGGQRQRIAIARALLKNAPILLLDEATSSLDNITEKEVQRSINHLMKNRTSLIIAHRLSTIEDADLIYIVDNGKGINKEIEKKVFDPFFTTKDTFDNPGLGLTISYEIISSMGGDIFLNKSWKNSETCFVVRIPIEQDNERDQLANLIEILHSE